MNRIGLVADEMDHHPEWTLKANCLKVELSTHEIGGKISIKDYILGYWIERILDTPALEDPLIKEWNTQNLNIKELL